MPTLADMPTLVELFVTLSLITVHGPQGQVIELNVNEISSIRQPRGHGHFTKDIKCLIFMTNGKFVSTVETCEQINKLIEATHS
jgi:hypothetical protein